MFARTERLLLRPGWAEDAPALHAAIDDEAVVSNLSKVPWPYSIEDARAYLGGVADARLPVLVVLERGGAVPRLIGAVGLHRDRDGEVELGYWYARAVWGCGYATEAGRAVIAMAPALGLRRLVSGHFVDNPASGRVLAKLGFQPTGRIAARVCRARGRLVPTKLFACELGAGGDRLAA